MMKNMMRYVVILCSFIFILSPVVLGIGISPPQLRIENAPMGEERHVATIVVKNTYDIPVYFVLTVSSLDISRVDRLRVICNGCKRDVGIQRGGLVNGSCPFCFSDNLIVYDVTPVEILDNITLSSDKYPLELESGRTYVSRDAIEPGGSMNLKVSLFIPNVEKYLGMHWEARVMATSVQEKGKQDMFSYGTEAKVLIDTPGSLPVLVEESNGLSFVYYVAVVFFVFVSLVLLTYYMVLVRNKKKKKSDDGKVKKIL